MKHFRLFGLGVLVLVGGRGNYIGCGGCSVYTQNRTETASDIITVTDNQNHNP